MQELASLTNKEMLLIDIFFKYEYIEVFISVLIGAQVIILSKINLITYANFKIITQS